MSNRDYQLMHNFYVHKTLNADYFGKSLWARSQVFTEAAIQMRDGESG